MPIPPATRGLHGVVIPGYVSKTAKSPNVMPMTAGGLHMRAVVAATRVFDEESVLHTKQYTPSAVYCDVIAYSMSKGLKHHPIPNCMVIQPRSGMHDGDIWIPRATTMDITGAGHTDPNSSDIMGWDGDHVLVTFLDDNLSLPIIIGSVPHPFADRGNTAEVIGERLRIHRDDGTPRIVKHHGVIAGVDTDGNVLLDTRKGHSGKRLSDGSEAPAPADGNSGNVAIRIQNGADLFIEGPNSTHTIHINGSDGSIAIGRANGDGEIHIDSNGVITVGADDNRIVISGTTEMGSTAGMKRGIARLNDTIRSNINMDTQFWTWLSALSEFVGGLANVAGVELPLTPAQLTGSIVTASSISSTE